MTEHISAPAAPRGQVRPEGRGRSWLINLTIVLASILICLPVMELATRVLLADVGTTGDETSFLSRRWAERHPPARNRLGFRERAFAAVPAPGVVRIAAVGDSFTYGAGILENERVSDRLEALLNRSSRGRFEVINFGRPGANYEQHLENLRVALAEAKPRFVLLQWYLNDVDDPVERRPKPRQPGSLWHHQLSGASTLYGLAAQVFADVQMRLGLVRPDAYYARYLDPADPIARRANERFRAILDLARENGTPIAIYIWPELTRPVGTSPNDRLIDRLLETCRREGIICVDLRPALAKVPDHGRLIVNRFDTHASAYANALATNEIAARLGPVWRDDPVAAEERK